MFTTPSFKLLFPFLILFIISNTETTLAATTAAKSTNKIFLNFIKTACNSTTYPQVCYKSLSSYASAIKTNPQKLCNTALSVTLAALRNTSALVTKLSKQKGLSRTETSIIKDCVETIGDSIDELKQSLKAMGSLGGSDVGFQIANIKTWVSAALTDEDTCMDGFDGKKVSSSVKNKISKSIVNVAKLTSNALALINRLNY